MPRLAGWLAGWLAGLLAGWLAGWLAAWLPIFLQDPLESWKINTFLVLGTRNAPGRSETDIGGPCQKPYINVTFWDNFLWSRSGKTSSGMKKGDLNGNFMIFPVLE